MKVLISGAGLAGPTVAYFLKQYGFSPTLVERAPTLLTGGYKLDIRGTALQVLRHLNIYDAVANAKTDMQGASVVDQHGKVITEMSGDLFGLRVGEDLEIIRGKLCQILMDQIPEVDCIFGDSIKSISQLSDGVNVEFKKNGKQTFDLVIGADGVHSNVRHLVFGDESLFAHNLGLYLCVFTVPNYLNQDRWETEYIELGRMVNIWSSRGDTTAKACFGFVAPSMHIDPDDVEQQQQLLKTVYKGFNWEVPRLLQAMADAPDFYFDAATQIHMDQWSQDRVVLLGDAGYCPSPMSGQGTSVALIGAYVLAGELAAAAGDYKVAFANYEKELRLFVKRNQALGISAAKLMRAGDNKGLFIWLHEQMMRIMPGRWMEFFIKRGRKRIKLAANSIQLKDYSAFLKS